MAGRSDRDNGVIQKREEFQRPIFRYQAHEHHIVLVILQTLNNL